MNGDSKRQGELFRSWVILCGRCKHRMDTMSTAKGRQEAVKVLDDIGWSFFEGKGWLCEVCSRDERQ